MSRHVKSHGSKTSDCFPRTTATDSNAAIRAIARYVSVDVDVLRCAGPDFFDLNRYLFGHVIEPDQLSDEYLMEGEVQPDLGLNYDKVITTDAMSNPIIGKILLRASESLVQSVSTLKTHEINQQRLAINEDTFEAANKLLRWSNHELTEFPIEAIRIIGTSFGYSKISEDQGKVREVAKFDQPGMLTNDELVSLFETQYKDSLNHKLTERPIVTGSNLPRKPQGHTTRVENWLTPNPISVPASATGSMTFPPAVTSHAEAVQVSRTIDYLGLFVLFFVLTGGYHVHAMLTMGDWDFWADWKDRRLWVTVTPIMLVTFPAATQAVVWEHFRLPFGATICCLGLLFGEWVNRYFNFWGWTYFPINFVFPAILTPGAILLDTVLLLTNSYLATAVFGGMAFGLLFYPGNWPLIAGLHMPVEYNGMLMSIADIQGYHYVRTGTPEYIRMVEKGTLRTFGKDVAPVSAFFSGFVCILIYFVWHFIGRWFGTTRFLDQT